MVHCAYYEDALSSRNLLQAPDFADTQFVHFTSLPSVGFLQQDYSLLFLIYQVQTTGLAAYIPRLVLGHLIEHLQPTSRTGRSASSGAKAFAS